MAAGAAAGEDRARAGLLDEKEGGRRGDHRKRQEYEYLVETSRVALWLVRTTTSDFSLSKGALAHKRCGAVLQANGGVYWPAIKGGGSANQGIDYKYLASGAGA